MRWHIAVLGALILSAAALQAQTLTRHEIIRGRVTTDSGKAIGEATVIATMAPDRVVFRTTSDAQGGYRLDVPNGTGDYLLYVSAVGRNAFRKRVTFTADSVVVVDAKLASSITQVATVTARATKLTPTRGPDDAVSTVGDATADGLTAALSSDLQGDLAAMAALMPGVVRTSDGISVFGLSSSQNSLTLNGAAFPGADLPRDMNVYVHVATTPFDPARGWASGAAIDARLLGSGVYVSRKLRFTVDQQSSGASIAGPGFIAGLTSGGRVDYANHYNYSLGVQAERHASDATTLLSASPSLMTDLGVASDSVARLVSLLGSSGIPYALAPNGNRPATENASLLFQVGTSPNHVTDGRLVPETTVLGLTAYGKLGTTEGLGFSPRSTPSAAGKSNRAIGSLTGSLSHYFAPNYLFEGRSTVGATDFESLPYIGVPQGHVLVQSTTADGGLATGTLGFAGGGPAKSSTRQLTWENSGELKFYIPETTHRLKLTADARYDYLRREAANYGSFTFTSLDDVAAGKPASFTRIVGASPADAGVWNAFLAAGDLWSPVRGLQLNYGARLEGAAYATSLPNPLSAVDARFGVHTGTIPGSIHVSPRAGFTWIIDNSGPPTRFTNLGRIMGTSASVLRGGVGEFRNITSPSPLVDALAAQRAGAVLTCVGSATPIPDWSAYAADAAAIPSSCLGSGPAIYSDNRGAVQVFDDHLAPSRSWRGNLSYSIRPRWIDLTLDETFSYNLDQPSVVDRNLAGTAAFVTANEGRPVFAPVAAVVPSSGIIAASGARADSLYGPVLEHRSDLRSTSNALTLMGSATVFQNYFARLSYTNGVMRSSSRALDATTFDGSIAPTWARGSMPRHQIQAQAGYDRRGFTVSGVAQFHSGTYFTPLVSGDVNGDGLANDRAYIADATTALGNSVASLISSGQPYVRDCLRSQLGTVAAQNSCVGPWTAELSASIGVARPELLQHRIRRIDLGFANILNRGSSPDPVLYFVRGFDATTKSFNYTVNPEFGSNRPSLARLLMPFRMTLDVSLDLSPPLAQQQLDILSKPGRGGRPGPRATAADAKRRYMAQVPDPFVAVIRDADTLLLSRTQVDSLRALDKIYAPKIDSIWTEFGNFFAQQGDDFDTKLVYQRQEDAFDRAWAIAWDAVHHQLAAVLNPIQLSMLSGTTRSVWNLEEYKPGALRLVR